MNKEKERKRGKFSDFELQSLADMVARGMSDKEIAETLNRSEEVVRTHRVKVGSSDDKESIVDQITLLKDKFYWAELDAQLLNDSEKTYFQNLWASLYNQFSTGEITHTDEMMIKDLCVMDIHLNRSLKSKKEALELIEQLDHEYKLCDDEIENDAERDIKKRNLNEMINAARSSLKNMTVEWKELQERKDKKFEQLKSTRQQRIETEEKAGKNFFDMLKLLDTFEKREREGYMNELVRLSAARTKQKFSEPTEYMDGEIDKVLLTPESVLKDKEEQDKERKVDE